MRYDLFAHEIYGNEEGYYEVNDSFKIASDIELSEDFTIDDLKAELDAAGVTYPADFVIDPHNCWNKHIELEEACGKPMGFLRAR